MKVAENCVVLTNDTSLLHFCLLPFRPSACCRLPAAMPAADCLLPAACCRLPAACCRLPACCCLPALRRRCDRQWYLLSGPGKPAQKTLAVATGPGRRMRIAIGTRMIGGADRSQHDPDRCVDAVAERLSDIVVAKPGTWSRSPSGRSLQ